MALVLKDRVKETSTTTGTGTFTLAGAATGFQSFSVIGNSNTVYYAIVRNGYDEWEIGIGTYTSSGTTLSRDTVLESSNSGSKVNFSAGTKEVFCTYPAEKAVTIDDVQTLSNKTLASPSVTGSITFSDSSTQNTAATGFGFKNRIINGAMMIDQRNNGATVAFSASTGASSYLTDRFIARSNVTSATGTFSQSNVTPSGFKNSLAVQVTTGAASGVGEVAYISQRIEGNNVFDLAWGTASAAAITLSFWVRSSLTGTFGGAVQNSAGNRSYPFTFAISAANTWQQKSVTIAGDTSGTWLTDNGIGLILYINLGSGTNFQGTAGAWVAADDRSATGATQVTATSGATFYITGVQLEKGSTATIFDYRPYGTELALCQRYYYRMPTGGNVPWGFFFGAFTSTRGFCVLTVPVPLRANSSITQSGCAITTFGLSMITSVSTMSFYSSRGTSISLDINTTSAMTSGSSYYLNVGDIAFDAEL